MPMKTDMMELLSIDADAHLQKLTAHMFPSPELLPVELVRSALKRRAATISIEVRADRLTISDDGDGVGSAEWQALACLGDTRQNAAAREKSLALIQDLAHPGIGLLAVFTPGVRRLQIDNAAATGQSTLRIENGLIKLQRACSWPRGTRIMISRRRGPAAEEKALLAELCAAAPAEIMINGRLLNKKPLWSGSLASMEIRLNESLLPASLAIPVQGDVCRIWLLDQSIPWQATSLAPVAGLVFSAALESTARPTPSMLDTLSAAAHRLYQWLAENYSQFSEPYQSRIEDLFFKQARSGGDYGLLSVCAPFRILRSPQRMTLAEVRRKAETGILYVMDHGSRSSHFSGPKRDILILTPRQKDFLINHLQLPIIILSAHKNIKINPSKVLNFWRSKFFRLYGLLLPAKAHIPDQSRLSCKEIAFCLELEMHWQRKITAASPEKGASSMSVVMVEGRGLVPARWLKNKHGDILRLRRRHPLVLRAMHKTEKERDSSELAFAALMPGYFLTVKDE